jgi:hypothetical protein
MLEDLFHIALEDSWSLRGEKIANGDDDGFSYCLFSISSELYTHILLSIHFYRLSPSSWR